MVMYIPHRLLGYMNNACTEYQCFGIDHFGWGSTEAALYSDAVLYLYVAMRSCDLSIYCPPCTGFLVLYCFGCCFCTYLTSSLENLEYGSHFIFQLLVRNYLIND